MDFYISFGCLALLASLLIRGLNTTQVGFQDFHILCQVSDCHCIEIATMATL